jgi:hypothetical protein
MSDSPGVEKETTAQKKDGASFRVPRADSAAAVDVLAACREMWLPGARRRLPRSRSGEQPLIKPIRN